MFGGVGLTNCVASRPKFGLVFGLGMGQDVVAVSVLLLAASSGGHELPWVGMRAWVGVRSGLL